MTVGWKHRPMGYGPMPATKPTKVPIHGCSPNVTTDSRGTVVETLCERYELKPVVVPPQVYWYWSEAGYTPEIFCGDCLRELGE